MTVEINTGDKYYSGVQKVEHLEEAVEWVRRKYPEAYCVVRKGKRWDWEIVALNTVDAKRKGGR